MTHVPSARALEITDLLRPRDPATGVRKPVEIEAALARLEAAGQSRAARILRRLPAQGGRLDDDEVDALLLRVHRELQRLAEELQLPRRLAEWLSEAVAPLSPSERDPVHVVDVGCGIGYVIRWLAACKALGPGVELVGVDLDAALVQEARRLAVVEELDCRFVVDDALSPAEAIADPGRTIVISTGFLHHFDEDELVEFFAAQQRSAVSAFAHWDVDPSGWATIGAWLFHRSRMREQVSRYDGVLSARRAHRASVLLAAAAAGAPRYQVDCQDGPRWRPTFSEVLRPIVGRLAQ